MTAALVAGYPHGIHIEDTGDKGIVHVRPDGTEMRYDVGSPASMVMADVMLRNYNNYDYQTPCGFYSNRAMQGGDDVVVPMIHFETDFMYLTPTGTGGREYLKLHIKGTCGGDVYRPLYFGDAFWGGIPTTHGVKHGVFKIVREGNRVSRTSRFWVDCPCAVDAQGPHASQVMVDMVEYDFERVLEEGHRLDQQPALRTKYPLQTTMPNQWMSGGRSTVLLKPLTHMLMMASPKRNLQDWKQGQIRGNYYNT